MLSIVSAPGHASIEGFPWTREKPHIEDFAKDGQHEWAHIRISEPYTAPLQSVRALRPAAASLAATLTQQLSLQAA